MLPFEKIVWAAYLRNLQTKYSIPEKTLDFLVDWYLND